MQGFVARKTRQHRTLGVLAAGFVWVSFLGVGQALAVPPCGSVITEDTELDGDMVCTAPGVVDGLVIGADGITLDLKGHSIIGPATYGPGAGVRVTSRRGVEVRNGSIQGFNEAVILNESTGNRVWNLTLSNNVRGINLAGSNENTIDKNRISSGYGDGIRLGLSARNRVVQNVVADNAFGIGVADFSTENRIAQNTVTGNRAFGIAVFSDSDRNEVARNVVTSTVENGLVVAAGCDDTVVSQNEVNGNGRDGISVEAATARTVLLQNKAASNADDGIDVESASTTVTKNSATSNGDLGIEAVPGVNDGGGNSASGNGNPAQCVGVACSAE